MNRALLLSVLSFSFLFAAPVLQGCSSGSGDESTADSSQDDLKKSCKGPLPDLCKICDDGSTGCAHWVKSGGKCEIEYCAPSTEVTCSGPLPHLCKLCDDGSDGCAHWVKSGGKCEIEYCAPSTGGGSSECTKDSDCKGVLPMSCEVCSDGSTGCAHHVCNSGTCGISYCD